MQQHLPSSYLLQNRYRITRKIGQGGFGITYEAFDETLETKVCIKELYVAGQNTRGANNSVLTQDIKDFSFEDFVNRFIAEARQLARFSQPNIVSVRDIFSANGTAYMVMEFLEGQTLKQLVTNTGALRSEQALPIFNQLLDAVETVHNSGMLHRDIKPDNILVTPANRVVLIDFGSARDFIEGKTLTHSTILTPGYAPIEQYGSKKQRGAYTDIYALGATLYFMLSATKPIDATDRYSEEMPAPHVLNPKISEQLSSAVMLAMQMKAEDRFQSVDEFRAPMLKMLKDASLLKDISDNSMDDKHISKEKFKPKTQMYVLGKKYWILTAGLCLLAIILTYFLKPGAGFGLSENFYQLDKGFKHTNEIVDFGVLATIIQIKATLEINPQHKPVEEAAEKVRIKIRPLLAKINDIRVQIIEESGGLYRTEEHKSKWEGFGYKTFTIVTDKNMDGKAVGSNNFNVPYKVFIVNNKGAEIKELIIETRKELVKIIDDLVAEIKKEPIEGVKLDPKAIEELKKELVLEVPDDDVWKNAGKSSWEAYVFSNIPVSLCLPILRKIENDAINATSQIVNFLSANIGANNCK